MVPISTLRARAAEKRRAAAAASLQGQSATLREQPSAAAPRSAPPLERGVSRVHYFCGTLHQLDTAAFDVPDFAVLFNSGIGTLNLPIVEPWLPTVPLRS